MIGSATKWIKHFRKSLAISDAEGSACPPNSAKAFQLATLAVLYDSQSYRMGAGHLTIKEIMTIRLQAGEWHPDATLDQTPENYFLDQKYRQWEKMVADNDTWFNEQAIALQTRVDDYLAKHEDKEVIHALESERPLDRDRLDQGSRLISYELKTIREDVIYGVACSLADRISVKPTSDFAPQAGKRLISPSCEVKIDIDDQTWVFDIPEDEVRKVRNSVQFAVMVGGVPLDVTDMSQVTRNKADMLNLMAIHAASLWKRSILLSHLNDQRLIKKSALLIAKQTHACYHEHLLEIHRFSLDDTLDQSMIKKYYFIKYNCERIAQHFISEIYKNIYVEKELAKW